MAMATHVQQHYVPEFLLRQWHSGGDKKLTQYQWLRGELRADRFTAKAVAKEPHLYSQRKNEVAPDVGLERDFLGPHIDEPAALVHKKLLVEGHENLNDQERYEWSRFLLSLLVRTPEMIEFMHQTGRHLMETAMNKRPDGLMHIRQGEPESSLKEWAKKNRQHILDDVGVRTLPAVLTSPELNHAILSGTWSTVSLKDSNVDALIADNPVVYLGDIGKGFSFMLPISPKVTFVVTSSPRDTEKALALRRTGLTKAINRGLVKNARKYVYATGPGHEVLIGKHLRKSE